MNDGMLSQEEIDALLNGEDSSELFDQADGGKLDEYLTPIEQDALGEIGNISFGSAATALSTLLNYKVDITTPKVSLVQRHSLDQEFPVPYVSVFVEFTDGLEGSNVLMIKSEDAKIIADIMLGGDGTNPKPEIDELQLSAVQEAMNQMMGSSATSMSTVFNKRVDISPPSIALMDVASSQGTVHIPKEEQLIKVSFNLQIGELVDSEIMQLIPIHFAKRLVDSLMQPEEGPPVQEVKKTYTESNGRSPKRFEEEAPKHVTNQTNPDYNIQPVTFSDFETAHKIKNESQNLDLLLDIPLKVTVELGKTEKTVKEILSLAPGSVVELDKLAGEHVDILINNKRIAKGEVVVIDENFGVRVTEILSQQERLRKLH